MTETYLIAITPPVSIQKRVLTEKRKYPKFSVYHLPAHITLYHPFASSIALPDLVRSIKASLGKVKPFSIRLHRYGVFEGKHVVLFFKPDPISTKLLTTVHKQVDRGIPEPRKEIHAPYQTYSNYHPHLTIAQNIPKRILSKLKSELKTLPKPLTFTCSRIDIYQRNPKSHTYTKVRHVLLQKLINN